MFTKYMRNHKPRRNRFHQVDRGYRRNGMNGHSRHRSNMMSDARNHSNRSRFLRAGGQNASKLVEKYTNLAKEALSVGDKILSENYYQHADHFLRISSNQNFNQTQTKPTTTSETENNSDIEKKKDDLGANVPPETK